MTNAENEFKKSIIIFIQMTNINGNNVYLCMSENVEIENLCSLNMAVEKKRKLSK